MEIVVFTAAVSISKYVNGSASGSFTGYKFRGCWSVRSTGIPNEGDSFSTGD